MKIDVNVEPKTTTIDDLVSGDTFYFEPSGVMWMKISEEIEIYDGIANAVSLDDGTLSRFYNYEKIVPIKTKVVNADEN